MNSINLIKNNDNKDWTDEEWIQEFYQFLQGENPESLSVIPMNLTRDEAFRVIYYLQEHLPVFPDTIEKCSKCDILYDSETEGYYSETELHNCEGCADQAYLNDNVKC